MATNEPIVAVATSFNKAPVAIVRISGEDLSSFLRYFDFPEPRQALFRQIMVDGELIDSGLVIYFKAPHSFTGEDIIEFQGHGSRFVLEEVINQFKALGARQARAGEFSERAFLNNKMDLVQAEAIADLIDAKSRASSKAALRTMSGVFSQKIAVIENALRHLRALVEGAIDFSDEEIDFIDQSTLQDELDKQITALDTLYSGAKKGRYLRDGVKIALVGPPNVGKSTLLNALIGEDRAITSDIEGTTRDVVDADFEIDGIPMTFIDTAGIRDSNDPIEKMGIERSQKMAQQANIVVEISQQNAPFSLDIKTEAEIIRVMNKVDIIANEHPQAIAISAKDGTGLDDLKREIVQRLEFSDEAEMQFSACERHIDAIIKAQSHISMAMANSMENLGIELVAEEVRLAHDALGEITGSVHADDILGDIFSSFCIGK